MDCGLQLRRPVRASSKRILAAWLLVFLICFGAVAVASFAARDWLRYRADAVDYRVRAWVIAVDSPVLERAAGWLAAVSSTSAMAGIALFAAIWLWRRCRQAAAALILAPPTAAALHSAAKLLVARMRPPGGLDKESSSFPSGHTATATAVLVTLAFVLRRERLISRSVATLLGVFGPIIVALARVYRDVHWATDVAGGWVVGLIVAAFAMTLYAWLRREQAAERSR